MATVTVDQQKLVLNAFAAIFQNNLVSADLVTWKQYDGEMNDRNGLNVSEQVGPRYTVTQTVDGVADLSAGVQDSVFGSEQFKINRTFGSSMGWGDFTKIKSIGDARESEAVKNAAINLAEQIDKYVMTYLFTGTDNWVGTPGNSVSTYDAFVSAYTRLKEEGVDDSDLRAVLTYGDKQALGATIVTSNPGWDALPTTTFRDGFSGMIGSIPTVFSQQIPILTVGTRAATGAAQINGANQNVNYKDVAISGAPGQYLSQTINIKNLTAGHTVVPGEVFTITSGTAVNAYDNRAQQSLGRLQQFTVLPATSSAPTTAYTADGSGLIANMRIFPAIIVPASGSGGDVNVNSAFATVTAAPSDSATIVWLGTASTGYKARAVIQKQCMVVNTIDLIMPATGIGTRKALTKVPLSVRMWQNSTFATGEHQVRFDVALTANWRDRRRACRLNGA